MTTTIGFIGLGIMGGPMARHLAGAGHDVAGHNRSPEKTAPLVEAGGRAAASVTEAVDGAEVVALMLPDSPDVEAVLTGDGGVFDTAKPGTLVVDFSTIRPDVAADLAARASERGLRMIDAPVSGGQAGAENAALSIMVGGAAEDVEAARPLLDVVGKTVVHVGPAGAGQTVKAANQLIVAGTIALVAEAITFLQAHGADLPAAVEVLGGGLAGSAVLDQKASKMLDREFAPGFRIDLHHKDMGIVTEAAREAGVVTPVAALVAQLVAATRAAGDGGLDHSALFRTIARLNGEDVS
ncbi:NAD(P)-dependent oxidoreductase [Pseudonocardia endophytica]|uniref:2-hydroxy-3-oxopropionate reductase n=1 Tax=Pseudonocardia endophytica TaxID=401976 RepID=A0A4R1I0B4_PSEEN|nr:NAD(P)-dependent oxidoreductase [Pseudonocardia endophytica]TCK25869.1 2-hydroxy-3-oxopropionate reductase [Pseudonocardia endophytica]